MCEALLGRPTSNPHWEPSSRRELWAVADAGDRALRRRRRRLRRWLGLAPGDGGGKLRRWPLVTLAALAAPAALLVIRWGQLTPPVPGFPLAMAAGTLYLALALGAGALLSRENSRQRARTLPWALGPLVAHYARNRPRRPGAILPLALLPLLSPSAAGRGALGALARWQNHRRREGGLGWALLSQQHRLPALLQWLSAPPLAELRRRRCLILLAAWRQRGLLQPLGPRLGHFLAALAGEAETIAWEEHRRELEEVRRLLESPEAFGRSCPSVDPRHRRGALEGVEQVLHWLDLDRELRRGGFPPPPK